MADAKHLTQAQAAALLGVTTRRLRQIAQDGDAPPAYLDAAGNVAGYPCEAFGRWLQSRWSPQSEDGDDLNPQQEKARLDKERRLIVELERAEREGRLVDVDSVADRWEQIAEILKSRLLSIPSRVAPSVARLSSVREVEDLLLSTLHEAMEEAANAGQS